MILLYRDIKVRALLYSRWLSSRSRLRDQSSLPPPKRGGAGFRLSRYSSILFRFVLKTSGSTPSDEPASGSVTAPGSSVLVLCDFRPLDLDTKRLARHLYHRQDQLYHMLPHVQGPFGSFPVGKDRAPPSTLSLERVSRPVRDYPDLSLLHPLRARSSLLTQRVDLELRREVATRGSTV